MGMKTKSAPRLLDAGAEVAVVGRNAMRGGFREGLKPWYQPVTFSPGLRLERGKSECHQVGYGFPLIGLRARRIVGIGQLRCATRRGISENIAEGTAEASSARGNVEGLWMALRPRWIKYGFCSPYVTVDGCPQIGVWPTNALAHARARAPPIRRDVHNRLTLPTPLKHARPLKIQSISGTLILR